MYATLGDRLFCDIIQYIDKYICISETDANLFLHFTYFCIALTYVVLCIQLQLVGKNLLYIFIKN